MILEDLPTLHFVSSRPYSEEKIKAISTRRYNNRPSGGLWTSPVGPSGKSHWTEFCESWEASRTIFRHEVLLTDQVRVAIVNCEDDLFQLVKKYPHCDMPEPGYEDLDDYLSQHSSPICWEALAQDYDAFWLTRAGLATACPFFNEGQPSLTSWDVETFLILNTSVVENVIPLGV